MTAILEELDEDALVRILSEPRNALVRQYQALMAMDGVELVFEEDALREIARTALEKRTGARGLRSIMESVMEDVMFTLPDEEDFLKGRKIKILQHLLRLPVRDGEGGGRGLPAHVQRRRVHPGVALAGRVQGFVAEADERMAVGKPQPIAELLCLRRTNIKSRQPHIKKIDLLAVMYLVELDPPSILRQLYPRQ